MIVLTLSATAAGASTNTAADRDWQRIVAPLQGKNDPLSRKLLIWLYATETDLPVSAGDLMAFARQNPDWPRLGTIREKIEENISGNIHPQEAVAWFAQNPPETAKGIIAYVAAARAMGLGAQAKSALQEFWRDGKLGKADTAGIAATYGAWLGQADHIARLDNMIWQQRFSEASYMYPLAGADYKALAQSRVALAQLSKNSDQLLRAVPRHLQNNEGLLYERLRWRRRKNMDAGAIELLALMPKNSARAEDSWKEINILARRKIELADYKGAYNITARHGMKEGTEYTQAEWLLGWLALRFMKNPSLAYQHFEKMYSHVQSAISKSRGAYWSARAAEASGNAPLALQWDKVASKYPSAFYGQLSHSRVHGRPVAAVFSEPPVDPVQWQAFQKRDIVRAARLLASKNMGRLADPFLSRLVIDAKTKQDYMMAARLAREIGRNYYAVQANKDAQQKLGVFIFNEGYPLLPAVPLQHPEKSLVHAIVYRESMFNDQAVSAAGALGLMQLMPATAKQVATRAGQRYAKEKLTRDPSFNVLVGSSYLGQMIDKYDGFYPMAIAAYNAGPSRVNEWISDFGDPRTGAIDVIDWIELIPIYETRNYVQRVMESYYMYRLRHNEPPRTVVDLARR